MHDVQENNGFIRPKRVTHGSTPTTNKAKEVQMCKFTKKKRCLPFLCLLNNDIKSYVEAHS